MKMADSLPVLAWLAFVAPAAAHAAEYRFTDLGTPGGTYSEAFSINSTGQVAGSSATATGPAQATRWNGTTATALDTLGSEEIGQGAAINDHGTVVGYSWTPRRYASFYATVWNGTTPTLLGPADGHSTARDINNAGQVVGFVGPAELPGELQHATLWNGGVPTDLGTLGGTNSDAFAINNAGLVVGHSNITGNAQQHATLWNGTTATDLGTLGGNNSYAAGINDAGWIVGYSLTADNLTFHATLWNGAGATALASPGATASQALAINAAGQIVGSGQFPNEQYLQALLWDGSAVVNLNSFLDAATVTVGWVLYTANGINDSGWITGIAVNTFTQERHAYLLATVVPEPASGALLLAGLGVVGLAAARRRRAVHLA